MARLYVEWLALTPFSCLSLSLLLDCVFTHIYSNKGGKRQAAEAVVMVFRFYSIPPSNPRLLRLLLDFRVALQTLLFRFDSLFLFDFFSSPLQLFVVI